MQTTFERKLVHSIRSASAVTDEALEALVEEAAGEKTSLFDTIVAKTELEEKALLGFLAAEAGTAPVDLERVQVVPEVLEEVDQDVAEYHRVLPLAKVGQVLTVAIADPFDLEKLDHLQLMLKCDLRPVVTSERALSEAIGRMFGAGARELEALVGDTQSDDEMIVKSSDEMDADDVDLSDVSGETSPVVKLTNMIIANAIREKASDIHIEPFEGKLRVRYRQDGVLRDVLSPPRNLAGSIASRIKIMASLDIAEKRRPQDGKFQVKIEGRAVDFRVSTLPVVHGEKIVMRVLDTGNLALSLDALGFEEKNLEDFQESIRSPYGMILITGPTGSGKSTTLYSAVQELYSEEVNFVTVEDPVEYQLTGINQVPVNVKRGVTFAAALRSILRQDPDVILIGEIRDAETVEIAVKAALTGHLVLSTLHTNDAASAITRMIDMGLDPFLVATSVVLVAAQRLCRRLCLHCREEVEVPDERLRAIGFRDADIGTGQLFRAVGCPRCHQGYKGRFAILETLRVSDPIRQIVLEGRSAIDIKRTALEEGMMSLRQSAIKNALRGHTALEEVLRVTMGDM